ncbi:MAG: hypothetical protein ABII88_11455 [Candidatus Omnitrophota bacterium]
MIRRIALFILAVMFCVPLLGLNGCTKKEKDPDRFYSSIYGFSIKFPQGWQTTQDKDTVVSALSPFEDDQDILQEAVGVIAQNHYLPILLDDWFASVRSEARETILRYREIETGQMVIGDINLKWIKRSYFDDIGEIVDKSYCFVKGNRGYIISCNSQPDKFSKYEKLFEESVKTFRFE